MGSIRAYVRAYARRHGQGRAAEAFGVSRHTLWRFLERDYAGRSLSRAILDAVGESVEAIEAATDELVFDLSALRLRLRREASILVLPRGSRGRAPAAVCRAPGHGGRVVAFRTSPGLHASRPAGKARRAGLGRLRAAPPERAGAARAAQVLPRRNGASSPAAQPRMAGSTSYGCTPCRGSGSHGRPRHRRGQGPYDLLLILSGGRSIGLLRHGPILPTSNLRYRLRSIERLRYGEQLLVTLVLTYADPGHPPSGSLPGRPRPPHHVRGDRGGAHRRRRDGRRLAAVGGRLRVSPARVNRPRRVPVRHRGVDRPAGRSRFEAPERYADSQPRRAVPF